MKRLGLNSADMRDLWCSLALLGFLGFLLIILRRPLTEGFASDDAIQCHADSPCPGHLKCINGFCAKTEREDIVEKEEIPLLSPGSPAPYF